MEKNFLLEQNLEVFNKSYGKLEDAIIEEVSHQIKSDKWILDEDDAKLFANCMNLFRSFKNIVNEQNKEIEKLHNEIEQIKTQNKSKIIFDPDIRV